MNLVDIQKALMTDDLAGAIKGMFDLDSAKNGNKFQNQIIHQSGRYHANEKANNIGTLSQDQYNRTRNQLRYALQQILNDFPGYSAEVNTQAQKAVMEDQGAPGPAAPAAGADIFKVLMLTSNPSGTGKLQLEKEHSNISAQLQNFTKKFRIKFKRAVTLSQFNEALLDEKPVIVHFSGHGEFSKMEKEVQKTISRGLGLDEEEAEPDENTGIILTSEDGRDPFFVSTDVIRMIFENIVQDQKVAIKAVIFNSCYSEAQAQALADIVPNVIGTSWKIKDEAAIAFANGFYSFLTRTENFKSAWKNGVLMAAAYGEPKERFIYFEDGTRVSR